MNINRNNYEEYFILYMDNELSAPERREVEEFAEVNPDLKHELDLLMQTKLVPEEITYSNKEQLYKTPEITNQEESLLLYLDNELDDTGRKNVERLIESNPAANENLNLLRKTKFQAEKIEFPDKQSLYRKEEKVRVVAMKWWRVAAAAVLLLGIVSVGNIYFNSKNTDTNGLAITESEPKPVITTDQAKSTTEKRNEIPTKQLEKEVDILSPDMANVNTTKQLARHTAINDTRISSNNVQDRTNDGKIMPDNNLPQPTENPNVINAKKNDIVDARLDFPSRETSNAELRRQIAVTPSSLQPLYTSNASAKENDDVSQKGKKGGFRGFVRKITRTFEKTTDFEATDGDDRLLVAGLAIKL